MDARRYDHHDIRSRQLLSYKTIDSFRKPSDFDHDLQTNAGTDFKPPGELLENYTSKGRIFEIWSGELRDPAVKQLIDRMQIFISFFIEGGTPLELEDQDWTLARWRVYFVYATYPCILITD